MGSGRELPFKYQAAITFVTMSFFSVIGFLYQQRLIREYVTDDMVDIHLRVKKIKERELAQIAAAGQRSSSSSSAVVAAAAAAQQQQQ